MRVLLIDKLSTCTNLLACFNDWTLALQDHCGVNVVYIDFAKAFDSVSHVKLIHRLKSYGIGDPLLLWIKNYLFDRFHCTRVGSVLSDFVYLISEVVQGSGLGPLLFVLYINELQKYYVHMASQLGFLQTILKCIPKFLILSMLRSYRWLWID